MYGANPVPNFDPQPEVVDLSCLYLNGTKFQGLSNGEGLEVVQKRTRKCVVTSQVLV